MSIRHFTNSMRIHTHTHTHTHTHIYIYNEIFKLLGINLNLQGKAILWCKESGFWRLSELGSSAGSNTY